MKFLFLIFALLVTLCASASIKKCSDRKDFFSQEKSNLEQSLKDFPLTTESVVLVGVEHLNYELKTYPLIIDAINHSQYSLDCFLLETELSVKEQIEINKLNKGLVPDWNLLESERSEGFINLIKLVNSKKIKIYAVDKDLDSDDDLIWLNERDKAMSYNISKLIQSKTCKRSIFPIGAIHILGGYLGRVNLKDHLTNIGLSTYQIGLSINGILEKDHRGQNKIGSISAFTNRSITLNSNISSEDFICKDIPKTALVPYTLNSKSFNTPVLYDHYTESYIGKMNDAKFWLYYSCQTKDCKEKNSLLSKKLSNIGLFLY